MIKSGLLFLPICSCLILFSFEAQANNLSISNVSLEARDQGNGTATVQFDLGWDNSWRDSAGNDATDLRDAVWVFFKVSKNGGPWVHGKMYSSGHDDGSGTALTIAVPSGNVGAMLYRTGAASGDIENTDVKLLLEYDQAPLSADHDDLIEVRVYGIEMVYIPQGDFYAGMSCGGICWVPGSTDEGALYALDPGESTKHVPAQITSTRPYISQYDNTDKTGTKGDISWYSEGYSGTLPGSRTELASPFPYGYDSFYIMKYELTQAQYRDFLNTLNANEQASRTEALTNNQYAMTDTASPSHRQAIKYKSSGTPFVCDLEDDDAGNESNDGEWIAMNYMFWTDCAAYADWAGLRPVTELEWEKAARGNDSYIYYFACDQMSPWTQTKLPLSNAGQNNEVASNTGDCLMNIYGSGSEVTGPMRVGFTAAASTTRVTANAGYYGVMELTGNVREMTVTIGNAAGRAFQGTHGDGILTTTASGYEGNATNTDWPGIDGTPARGVTGLTGSGNRGGGFFSTSANVRVVYRYFSTWEPAARADTCASGCRLGRTP